MTGISLYFFGTASGSPSPARGVSCIGFKYQQANWLFDCGDGSQIQIQKVNFRTGKISKIFITHLHGDHIFGLPGLLCTIGLNSSDTDGLKHIDLYGPQGLRLFIRNALQLSESCLGYTYSVHELELESIQKSRYPQHDDTVLHVSEILGKNIQLGEDSGVVLCRENCFTVNAFQIHHKVLCFGYVIQEDKLSGKLNANLLKEKGLAPGPSYGDLKKGIPISLPSGETIFPEDVMEPDRDGRRIVILGDTSDPSNLKMASINADILVHEATFENALLDKALEHGHSTPGMAAKFAKSVKAKKLVLTHFSQRYRSAITNDTKHGTPSLSLLVDQARKEFDGEIVAAEDLMVLDIPFQH